MNTKLTLSLDSKVIESAKKLSKKRGESISKMVEDYLIKISKPIKHNSAKSSILELRGIAGSVPKNFDYKKEIADYLMEKYK